MPLDSTANLLFNISANSDDAQGNIQRFRGILSKDLSGIEAEMGDWTRKVFGQLTSVQGIVTAGAAALGAAMAAVGTFANHATEKYAEYVSEVAHGSKVTGIGIRDMSTLAVAADNTQTSFEALTKGVSVFAANVVKANHGGEEQMRVLKGVGLTTQQVAAGEKNLYPLLEATAERFRNLKSGTEQAAMARDLFSRGGPEMLSVLRLGKDGLREMAEEAEHLGLALTSADVEAVKRLKAAKNELEDRQQAIDVAVGRATIGLKVKLETFWAAFAASVTGTGEKGFGLFGAWDANYKKLTEEIDKTARAMTNLRGTEGLDDKALTKPKEAAANYYGLTSVLESMKAKLAETGDEQGKVNAEIQHLQFEAGKAAEEYRKLRAEGKLTAEAAQREAGVLALLPSMILTLSQKLTEQVDEKQRLAIEQTGEELAARIQAQSEKTFAQQGADWTLEIARLRTQLEKKKELTVHNQELLGELEAAGRTKLERERLQAFAAELTQVQQHMAQIVTANMTAGERLRFAYDQDLSRYSEVEMMKTEAWRAGGAQRQIIEEQYAMARQALLTKFGADLATLQNSQGWQGVFGSKFGELLRRDEAALRQWQQSNHQTLLMAQMAYIALGEIGKRAFEDLAQGQARAAVGAFIYSKSIGQAMRAALASTLETIAAEAAVQAIYATALGLVRLAQHDYAAAASAFSAAATFGLVAGAAMVAGRLVAPKQGGSEAAAGGSAGVGGGSGSASDPGAATREPHTTVIVNIQGHIVGWTHIDELTSAISDAVVNRDTQLTATNTTTSKVVRR